MTNDGMTNDKPGINTSKRLLDLVRYMRAELHEAGLITYEEFTWLLTAPDEGKIGQGSISARRLEDYDEIRARLNTAEAAFEKITKVTSSSLAYQVAKDYLDTTQPSPASPMPATTSAVGD
jgi:hypothetical protein